MRHSIGWSQKQTADLFDVKPTTIWRWEHGWPTPYWYRLMMTLLVQCANNRQIVESLTKDEPCNEDISE